MGEIITACIMFAIAAAALVLSIRSFMGKGFLLNNAYLYASQKERENMDKTPHYRQSAIVFLLISLVFVMNGLTLLLSLSWGFTAVMTIAAAALGYAIVSSIAIERKKNKK